MSRHYSIIHSHLNCLIDIFFSYLVLLFCDYVQIDRLLYYLCMHKLIISYLEIKVPFSRYWYSLLLVSCYLGIVKFRWFSSVSLRSIAFNVICILFTQDGPWDPHGRGCARQPDWVTAGVVHGASLAPSTLRHHCGTGSAPQQAVHCRLHYWKSQGNRWVLSF